MLLFGKDKGLTPYKLKMLLYPQLIESGHIITPWNHMCEGLEKSNHNANKAFQSKTMRGGGKQSTQDPLFFELQFSLLKLFRKQSIKAKQVSINDLLSKALGVVGIANQADEESKTYNDICLQPVSCASIAVGETRDRKYRFLGLYFFVVGHFGSMKNEDIQNAITDMSGTVCTKASAKTLLLSHSTCPNCFVVMKDEKELRKSTDVLKDPSNDRVDGRAEEVCIRKYGNCDWTSMSQICWRRMEIPSLFVCTGFIKIRSHPGSEKVRNVTRNKRQEVAS